MPDKTQSERLLELRNVFPMNTREIQTIELRQVPADVGDELDLVFVIDTTGSMGGYLDTVAEALAGVAAGIVADFPTIRYSCVTFKDEDETEIVLSGGQPFYDLATLQSILEGLVAEGGGDGPENGYGAAYMAARELPWSDEAARAVILVTDVESHERGKTLAQAKSALKSEGVFFFYGLDLDDPGYQELADGTRGAVLTENEVGPLTAEIVGVLHGIAAPVEPPVYLVHDNRNFTALLEDGEEVTFQRRSFAIDPFSSGEDGAIGIPLKIDNSDLAVSQYIARAKANLLPVEVVIRIYEEGDVTGPQNNPPLRLYAGDFESRGSVVSCQLTWIDLHNAVFPNEFYTPSKCPSLQ